MRIEVRVQGGFAGIRRPPLVLETTDLEPGTARELESRGPRRGGPRAGGPAPRPDAART
jgi:hypothetical protein